MQLFIVPILVSSVALVAVFMWGGWTALLLATMLSILEVTLSFDNAVVNAKVLKRMSDTWQRRFLTWGILVSVFGTRLVLPALIVAVAAAVSPWTASLLAFEDPEAYAALLSAASPAILSFGSMFLLMVSLKYFFDTAKEVHWISVVEKHLAKWGRIEAVEIALALVILLGLSYFAHAPQATILVAGIIGIVLFVVIEGVAQSLSVEGAARSGLVLFAYLNVLDAAFSLDGVIGAFALTTAIPIIFAGLGIGAYFVRTLTVYMVRQKTLDNLIYLEHGAHWAIFGLAISMLAGIIIHVPEAVTGLIGLLFVGLSYYSSLRERVQVY